MGFLDKIKGAMNAVTGNAAKVELEFMPAVAYPGDKVKVTIKATSTGNEVKSKGVFVDLQGREEIKIKRNAVMGVENDVAVTKTTLEQALQIAPAFVLGKGETKVFEGMIEIPTAAQPSYAGAFTAHQWEIRGRLEAFGNDPDSGYKPLKVGSKILPA